MISVRRYEAGLDLLHLCEFVMESSMATLHVGDLLLKLTDPSLDPEKDVCLWEDDGHLVGFAFVQLSCAELNFATKPCSSHYDLESQIMDWAIQRFKRIAEDSSGLALFFTSVREDDCARISLLERYGFTPEEHYCVSLYITFDSVIPEPNLPEGFTVRHLAGAHELKAYVAAHRNAFLMDNLTEQWRRMILDAPYYIPELDLVVIAPDGDIAACCLCWLEPNEEAPDGPKKGYMQTLGTCLKFQNMGVGRAIFLEALHRFQAFGAPLGVGRVEISNTKALRLYESAGLRPQYKTCLYSWMLEV